MTIRYRLRHSAGVRPSTAEALGYQVRASADAAAPLSHRQPLAVVLDKSVAAAIARLGRLVRPDAVLGRVRAGVVFAFQAVRSARSLSHVGKEGLETISPSVRHRDAATSISRKLWEFAVVASALRSVPRSVFGSLGHPVRAVDTHVLANAAATQAYADLKTVAADVSFVAAQTATARIPNSTRSASIRLIHDCPVVETVAHCHMSEYSVV